MFETLVQKEKEERQTLAGRNTWKWQTEAVWSGATSGHTDRSGIRAGESRAVTL